MYTVVQIMGFFLVKYGVLTYVFVYYFFFKGGWAEGASLYVVKYDF